MHTLFVPLVALGLVCSRSAHARPKAKARPTATRSTTTGPITTAKSKVAKKVELEDDVISPNGPDTPVLKAQRRASVLKKVTPVVGRAPSRRMFKKSKNVRLVATFTQNDPQDESTDEVFYKLVAVRADHGAVSHHHVSKGEWSMGAKANHFMLHNLFEGKVGAREDVAFVLVVADNDRGGDWQSGNTIAAEERAADWGLARVRANVPVQQRQAVRDQLAANVRQAVHDVLWGTDDLLGFVAFAFQNGKLKVFSPSGSFSRIETASIDAAKITLHGLGSNYTVDLSVQDAATPAPRRWDYLSTEDEECDQHHVRVTSENGGEVVLGRGQVKDVDVVWRHIAWRCGDEQEVTDGPANTHWAVVRRKPTGEDMYMFLYSYFVAHPAIDLL